MANFGMTVDISPLFRPVQLRDRCRGPADRISFRISPAMQTSSNIVGQNTRYQGCFGPRRWTETRVPSARGRRATSSGVVTTAELPVHTLGGWDQAPVFMCSANAFQVAAAKVSTWPPGFLLSRTATAWPAVPTSTQVPPLLPQASAPAGYRRG